MAAPVGGGEVLLDSGVHAIPVNGHDTTACIPASVIASGGAPVASAVESPKKPPEVLFQSLKSLWA